VTDALIRRGGKLQTVTEKWDRVLKKEATPSNTPRTGGEDGKKNGKISSTTNEERLKIWGKKRANCLGSENVLAKVHS